MDVLTGPERRRHRTAEQKLAMVRESFEPGKSVSLVARQHGVNPNQSFHWRKLYQDGSLSALKAGEEVVPASELADALKQIRELQRVLGKKTVENETLREAVEHPKPLKTLKSQLKSEADAHLEVHKAALKCGGDADIEKLRNELIAVTKDCNSLMGALIPRRLTRSPRSRGSGEVPQGALGFDGRLPAEPLIGACEYRLGHRGVIQ